MKDDTKGTKRGTGEEAREPSGLSGKSSVPLPQSIISYEQSWTNVDLAEKTDCKWTLIAALASFQPAIVFELMSNVKLRVTPIGLLQLVCKLEKQQKNKWKTNRQKKREVSLFSRHTAVNVAADVWWHWEGLGGCQRAQRSTYHAGPGSKTTNTTIFNSKFQSVSKCPQEFRV